ncbi:MAG TPA: efflux RND transporter permease subunit, partial [Spirochaetia bacterium]|nr:efflux RND transporter permease subunit [Spirochaetia bacterium]
RRLNDGRIIVEFFDRLGLFLADRFPAPSDGVLPSACDPGWTDDEDLALLRAALAQFSAAEGIEVRLVKSGNETPPDDRGLWVWSREPGGNTMAALQAALAGMPDAERAYRVFELTGENQKRILVGDLRTDRGTYERLRSLNPDRMVVLGGTHAPGLPESGLDAKTVYLFLTSAAEAHKILSELNQLLDMRPMVWGRFSIMADSSDDADSFSLLIFDDDRERLRKKTDEALRYLSRVTDTVAVGVIGHEEAPVIDLQIDDDRFTAQGIDRKELIRFLCIALGTDTIPLHLPNTPVRRLGVTPLTPATLQKMTFRNRDGVSVPLTQFTRQTLTQAPVSLLRVDGKRCTKITIRFQDRISEAEKTEFAEQLQTVFPDESGWLFFPEPR